MEVLYGYIFMTLATALGAAYVWGPGWLRERREERILREGELASARIVSAEDTGNRFNSVPEIRIRLEVTRPGQAPYMTETKTIGVMFEPGRVVGVRVDPARPDRIAIIR
jgi:hypothetical protein